MVYLFTFERFLVAQLVAQVLYCVFGATHFVLVLQSQEPTKYSYLTKFFTTCKNHPIFWKGGAVFH